jgi:hypothetical protein
MPYTLTAEQQDIISTAVTSPVGTILKINACAGASKTYTLLKVSEALPHSDQLYLAYNKAIAEESKSKFPSYVQCKTTHSLAFTPIVKYGLDLDGHQGKPRVIGTFTHRDLPKEMEYDDKLFIISHLEAFFLSSYTCIDKYMVREGAPAATKEYFLKMVDNDLPCTHGFYLKMYHILLVEGHIHYDKPFDVIMLDEAGDINEVTLGIFLALPANLKIMVGDPLQNIYSFNHTINGFVALKDVGVTKHLSQSFRCSEAIADSIESFCQRHLDPDTIFRGTEHADTTIRSEAIISRTNSGLIQYMITMASTGIEFNLTREAKHIFASMLTLMNLKEGGKIFEPSLKFLQKDVDHYFKSPTTRAKHKTCLLYIKSKHETEEPNIKVAIQTILKYGASKIYDAYNFAKKCEATHHDHAVTLTTAHSSKGLTFDSVTIADDFNLSDILEMKQSERSNQDQEELRLYYVCCSRARLRLLNAIYLRR